MRICHNNKTCHQQHKSCHKPSHCPKQQKVQKAAKHRICNLKQSSQRTAVKQKPLVSFCQRLMSHKKPTQAPAKANPEKLDDQLRISQERMRAEQQNTKPAMQEQMTQTNAPATQGVGTQTEDHTESPVASPASSSATLSEAAQSEGKAPSIADDAKSEGKAPSVTEAAQSEGKAPSIADDAKSEGKAPSIADDAQSEGKAPSVADEDVKSDSSWVDLSNPKELPSSPKPESPKVQQSKVWEWLGYKKD